MRGVSRPAHRLRPQNHLGFDGDVHSSCVVPRWSLRAVEPVPDGGTYGEPCSRVGGALALLLRQQGYSSVETNGAVWPMHRGWGCYHLGYCAVRDRGRGGF